MKSSPVDPAGSWHAIALNRGRECWRERIAQTQRDAFLGVLWCSGCEWTRAIMTAPIEDPTLQKIDELLSRLRAWQNDATTLLSDADVRERVEHALLDVAYVFEYLKAARSEKEEKLKLAS